MQKWEYHAIRIEFVLGGLHIERNEEGDVVAAYPRPQDVIAEAGQQGWELVSAVAVPTTYSGEIKTGIPFMDEPDGVRSEQLLWFKRPKE